MTMDIIAVIVMAALALWLGFGKREKEPLSPEQERARKRQALLDKVNERYNESDPTQRNWWG